MRALDLVVAAESLPEFGQGRHVEVEVESTVADGGPRTFGWRHAADATGIAVAPFVVPALVSSQGLARGEALVAYRALVRPSGAVDGGGHGCCWLVVGSGVLPVTGLVPA